MAFVKKLSQLYAIVITVYIFYFAKDCMNRTYPHDAPAYHKAITLVFLTAAVFMVCIPAAHAGTLCVLVNFALGNFGKGLATLGVLGVGIGATMGKISWTMAITVAVGIAVIFGCSAIAATIINGAGNAAFAGLSTAC